MLEVCVHRLGEVVVLRLQGRIVNGETQILRSAVSSLSDSSAVILDFAKVNGVDAHGLGVLLELREQLKAMGTEFRLINVTRLVRQVLEITRLDSVFQLTTEAESVTAQSLANPSGVAHRLDQVCDQWRRPMDVRNAEEAELDALAKIWHEAWHDAHAQIVPAELTRLRTRESFRERLQAALRDLRVAGPPDAPVGFHLVKDDELYQLFVAAPSRGSGVATALIADAEARLSENGVQTAWLACAIGNERAAKFYEKNGWHRTRTMINQADTSNGTFPLKVWRYEKSLSPKVAESRRAT